MPSLRIISLLCAVLVLAGCYRQSDDSFVAVDSENGSAPQVIATQPESDNPTPVIIEPTVDDAATTDTSASDENPVLATNTPQTGSQSNDGAEPTIVIIEVASDTPQAQIAPTQTATLRPAPDNSDNSLLATSTPITLITPDLGGPSQIEFPTETPTVEGAMVEVTDEAGEVIDVVEDVTAGVSEDCIYVIQSGDNLFRIAIDNNTSLNDLLTANNLTENSIIQPGEELVIPDCNSVEAVEDADSMAETDDGTGTTSSIEPALSTTPLPSGSTLHRVTTGETLSVIARQYGVSIQAIVDANNLVNPNALSIGQELIIPQE